MILLELEYESKIIKKLLVIKAICSWLPLGRWTESLQPRTYFFNGVEVCQSCQLKLGYIVL